MRKVMLAVMGCAVTAFVAASWAADEAPKVEATALFDFEEQNVLARFDTTRAEKQISTEHATSGKQSMKVTLKAGEGNTSLYTERFPVKDWSGYSTLKFDVFADEAVKLTMTIKDPNSKNYVTRFNQDEVAFNKGANTIAIALADVAAKIDLKKIKSMTLSTGALGKDVAFYVDNVRLEK